MINILWKGSDSTKHRKVCEPGGKTREMFCEPRGGGEMGGSTCIMTVLLFNLYNDCIIAHTSTECMLESTSSSDVEEN